MRILGIETSCDETAAAVVEDGTLVRSNVIATSKELFEQKAGVIPEEAARRQVECMLPVLHRALEGANTKPAHIDAIAVTKGPGLLGSLLVGTTTARTLASLWGKPLVPVHHTLGHLSSTWLGNEQRAASDALTLPILTLSASGGHTDLWYRTAHTKGKLLGATRDDAAGEAFDKGAALLGLPYPGGPAIANVAEGGHAETFSFPLPLKGEDTLDFSFSGLKTSLKYLLYQLSTVDYRLSDLAASYQHALSLHLIDRILRALDTHPNVREIHLVGGVSANLHLRNLLHDRLSTRNDRLPVRWPAAISFCTDNAAMIAAAGFFLIRERGQGATEPFETHASLSLAETLRMQ